MEADDLVRMSRETGSKVVHDHTNGLRFALLERDDFVSSKRDSVKGRVLHMLKGRDWEVSLVEP